MSDMEEFNRQVVEEFRANEGRVGGMFEGAPMILVTTTGRKSGEPRLSPLVYTPDGDGRYVIAGSKGGAPENPAWYLNIAAGGPVRVEVGTEAFDAKATVEAEGPERDRLWNQHAELMPNFREYEKATDRVIPMVVLERA